MASPPVKARVLRKVEALMESGGDVYDELADHTSFANFTLIPFELIATFFSLKILREKPEEDTLKYMTDKLFNCLDWSLRPRRHITAERAREMLETCDRDSPASVVAVVCTLTVDQLNAVGI